MQATKMGDATKMGMQLRWEMQPRNGDETKMGMQPR